MKIIILLIFSIIVSGCGWVRIGDLTMVATRNIDTKTDYKLIQNYVEGKGKAGKGVNPLEQAIDETVKKINGGEFLKNVKIYIKDNGQKVKIEGDVWGIPVITPNN